MSWRLRQAFALTRTELGTLAPAARWVVVACAAAILWLRTISGIDAPVGSAEQRGLLTALLSVVACVLFALPFDAEGTRRISGVLKPLPITGPQAVAAKLGASLFAITVACVAVVGLDLGLAVCTSEARGNAASSILGSPYFASIASVLGWSGIAATLIAAAVLRHTLGALIAGLMSALALVTQADGSRAIHIALSAGTTTILAALVAFCVIVSPLRGRRGRIVVGRLALIACVLAVATSAGAARRMMRPEPTLESPVYGAYAYPSPDGHRIALELFHSDAWPEKSLWFVDTEALSVERVPDPGLGIIGLGRDPVISSWSDDSQRVHGYITKKSNGHWTARFTLTPTGEWETVSRAEVLGSSRRRGWHLGGHASGQRDVVYTCESGAEHRLPRGADLFVARDDNSVAIAALPGGLLVRLHDMGERDAIPVRLPQHFRLRSISPDASLAIASRGGNERWLIDLDKGRHWEVPVHRFTNRGTALTMRKSVEDTAPQWLNRRMTISECQDGVERELPFRDVQDIAHLHGDRWLVLNRRDGLTIRHTDGSILMTIRRHEGMRWIREQLPR